MRIINSKVHGVLDYLVGILLIAAPWLFGFSDVMVAMWVSVVFGAITIGYSLLTQYELGVWPAIEFNVHRWLDMTSGVLLLISPWFFGFRDEVRVPFVVFGLIEIIVPLLTQHNPFGHHIEEYDGESEYEPVYPAHGHTSH